LAFQAATGRTLVTELSKALFAGMAFLVYRVVAWQALQTGGSLFTFNALRVNKLLAIFAYVILVEVALHTPF